MKHVFALLVGMLSLALHAQAQVSYPYNPDENGDAYVSTPDLMEFLTEFGHPWAQGQVLVDSIPLDAYLQALEAMIQANSLSSYEMARQDGRWDGQNWVLVQPYVGCTVVEACNYDSLAHILDMDKCVFQDACGVCGGPGEVYECGCEDVPAGDCDCDGNQLDALFVCGGTCLEDADGDGVCDDEGADECVGQLDVCGICNGPGPIYTCGCQEIQPGVCDCSGTPDVDGDGICDDVDSCIGNVDSDGDGICDGTDTCDGVEDECGVCNGPGAIYTCGCNDIPEGDCDCDGNQLDALYVCGGSCWEDPDFDGVCDFTCGEDSIPHQGHMYPTVAIGNQCWFAESCRYLPEVRPMSALNHWEARGYVPGYDGEDVSEAMATEYYVERGAQYNKSAVEEWELCPSGWHVGSSSELIELANATGGLAYAGGALKDSVDWNGTDDFGFKMKRATGSYGWVSLHTSNGSATMFRFTNDTDVHTAGRYRQEIAGARCLRDQD